MSERIVWDHQIIPSLLQYVSTGIRHQIIGLLLFANGGNGINLLRTLHKFLFAQVEENIHAADGEGYAVQRETARVW